MVEVIKKGNTRKIICTKCGAILRYRKTDIRTYYHSCHEIQCPECDHFILVCGWDQDNQNDFDDFDEDN